MVYKLVGAAQTIDLGKDGSKWGHNWTPLNAAALALKAHKSPGGGGGHTVKEVHPPAKASEFHVVSRDGKTKHVLQNRGAADRMAEQLNKPGEKSRLSTSTGHPSRLKLKGDKGREASKVAEPRASGKRAQRDSHGVLVHDNGGTTNTQRDLPRGYRITKDRSGLSLEKDGKIIRTSSDESALRSYAHDHAKGDTSAHPMSWNDKIKTEKAAKTPASAKRGTTFHDDATDARTRAALERSGPASSRAVEPKVAVYNTKTGKVEHVSPSEATAGHIRYGQSLGAGSAAAGQTVKNALAENSAATAKVDAYQKVLAIPPSERTPAQKALAAEAVAYAKQLRAKRLAAKKAKTPPKVKRYTTGGLSTKSSIAAYNERTAPKRIGN